MKTQHCFVVASLALNAASALAFQTGAPAPLAAFAGQTGQPAVLELFEHQLPTPPLGEPVAGDPRPETVSDYELEQFLGIVRRLESPLARNQRIEECFTRNKYALSWRQVRRLLGAVTHYSSHNYYDEVKTNDRIVEAFLAVRKADVPAWLAAEIAGSHKGALGNNQLLEAYYEANRQQLRWEEVRVLLRSIKYYSSHNYYDEEKTNDRIVVSYLELSKHRIDPQTALEVAGSHKSPLGTNQLIESYFMANRQALGFEQVQYLLRGIRYYSSHNYYDEVRTKERIVSAAGCRLCP